MLRSLLPLLGLRWYEYLFIGALAVASIFGFIWYQSYVATAEELAVATEDVKDLQEELVETAEREIINQNVVTMINQELVATRHQQTLDREAIVNEYLFYRHDIPEAPSDDPVEPDPESSADVDPVVSAPPKPASRASAPTAKESEDISRARLRQLTDGMRDVYCAAAESDQAGCPAK